MTGGEGSQSAGTHVSAVESHQQSGTLNITPGGNIEPSATDVIMSDRTTGDDKQAEKGKDNDAEQAEKGKEKETEKPGRFTSWVWAHYTRVQIKGKKKATCNYCGTHMMGDPSKGTTHLANHYHRCSRRTMKDVGQQVLQASVNKEKFELSPFNFDQEASRVELARMIIMHEYPLSMVEHEGFRAFANSLNPCFKIVSRNTIKSDCCKIYNIERANLVRILEKVDSRVAVTTDMWTSSTQKKGFMAITAHFIDNSWNLQSRIMSFVFVPSPHTSEVLCEVLLNSLMDWNIDGRLSTITVDNCTTNDAMLNLITEKIPHDSLLLGGKLLHMRCSAHILNLIVKEGMDVIGEAIEKVRDSVAYWSGTQKRCEKFEDTARQLRISTGKKLILDCKTRWNSTFLMLKVALEYKDVFFRLQQRESNYKCFPSELDWERTKDICEKLSLFYEATEVFSGTKYPTANTFFPIICNIKGSLDGWVVCGNAIIEAMALSMQKKFDKYWSISHGMMGIAAIFDPRYKVVLLDYYFHKIYSRDVDDVEFEVEKIVMLCRELVDQYEEIEKSKCKGDLDTSDAMKNQVATDTMVSLNDFDIYVSQKKRKHPARSELDHYLDEDIIPRSNDFDVLAWWKSNKGKYPILHKIARDILAIPVSTVASESAFSASGRLVGAHRSRLHPKTVEMLMCAQNWLLNKSNGHSSETKARSTVFDDSEDEANVSIE